MLSTIAPAALYFLLHALHDRVQGNWLAPLFPACAILAADWVAERAAQGASGWRAPVAKAALWAAPLGLAVMALAFLQATTGFLPLGAADPTARLEGFRDLARDLDARARAEGAPYVLTQGYALTSLMRFYGDPVDRGRPARAAHPLDLRAGAAREPCSPSPGLALGEAGRHFDLILKMRYRSVEPLGAIERRRDGRADRDLRTLPRRRPLRAGARSGLPERRSRSQRQCRP